MEGYMVQQTWARKHPSRWSIERISVAAGLEPTSLLPKGSIQGDDNHHVSKAAKRNSVNDVTKLMLQMKHKYEIKATYLRNLASMNPIDRNVLPNPNLEQVCATT
jgi:hypothetical protein